MATVYQDRDLSAGAQDQLEAYLAGVQRTSLLRFITCGSVDDGKSTLIGRLLYDSKMLFEDQLAALAQESRSAGGEDAPLDLALLVDGLAAEREQGITIDVAYRFFATETRKFIVADTPGHEQYTRNMVTGASTADLAVILIDARKGVLPQTRRHSLLVHLLGIRQLVLAVNKMDLVGYDQEVFTRIVVEYHDFARQAGIDREITAIPLSGLDGDNVTRPSAAMPWYRGPHLLEHLETVPVAAYEGAGEPFRLAVQWVNRPHQDFRGYAGRIASGRIRVGDEVAVLPAGRRSRVAEIVTFDGGRKEAVAGESITLTLTDELDCSRGDVIASPGAFTSPAGRLSATLVWMADEKMVQGRSYWLKIGTQTVSARIDGVSSVIDVNSSAAQTGRPLDLNDIGEVEIALDRAIPVVPYAQNRRLGSFILIDKLTRGTIAAGMVQDIADPGVSKSANEGAGSIRWITGTRRTAFARQTFARLKAMGQAAAIIDDATLAPLLKRNDGELVRIAREVAKLMSDAGVQTLVTIEADEKDAWPGRRIDADRSDPLGDDEWVI